MEMLVYQNEYTILMRDCDTFGRLKPSSILSLFQDSSEVLTESWGVGLDAMLEQGVGWVAAKLEVTVTARLPRHAETVTVRGWAARSRAGIYPFRYDLLAADGTELVRGCSMWVLSDLSAHTMMSGRVPRITLPTPEPDDAPLPRMRAIRPPREIRHTPRKVRFSELDLNGHLTNTRYADWATDLASRAFHETHPMTGLRIDYRRETFGEEELDLAWELTDERLYCASEGRFALEITF